MFLKRPGGSREILDQCSVLEIYTAMRYTSLSELDKQEPDQ